MSILNFLKSNVDDVIGRKLDDEAVAVFLSTLGPASSEYVFDIAGVELIVENGEVVTVFLKRTGVRSPDFLPRGITFVTTRAEARKKLGEPTKSDDPSQGISAGAWDRWDGPERCVHVEYADDGGVEMVTIMRTSRAP